MASILCLETTLRPHCILFKSSLHPHGVLIASLWPLSYFLRQLRVPIASSSNPHCILMASILCLSTTLRLHCVFITSSLHPYCISIASYFHPPDVLISSFLCISSTYSFYNPLVSASSFHYILTFLICTIFNLISKEKCLLMSIFDGPFFWREHFCLASRHTILRCLFFHHEFQKWKNLIMMIYCMVVRLFCLLQSNHSDPQSKLSFGNSIHFKATPLKTIRIYR